MSNKDSWLKQIIDALLGSKSGSPTYRTGTKEQEQRRQGLRKAAAAMRQQMNNSQRFLQQAQNAYKRSQMLHDKQHTREFRDMQVQDMNRLRHRLQDETRQRAQFRTSFGDYPVIACIVSCSRFDLLCVNMHIILPATYR